jgi:hypothetical protein
MCRLILKFHTYGVCLVQRNQLDRKHNPICLSRCVRKQVVKNCGQNDPESSSVITCTVCVTGKRGESPQSDFNNQLCSNERNRTKMQDQRLTIGGGRRRERLYTSTTKFLNEILLSSGSYPMHFMELVTVNNSFQFT